MLSIWARLTKGRRNENPRPAGPGVRTKGVTYDAGLTRSKQDVRRIIPKSGRRGHGSQNVISVRCGKSCTEKRCAAGALIGFYLIGMWTDTGLGSPWGSLGKMRDPWFDEVPERRGSWSEKWDQARANELPLWVADMDFRAPPVVLDALRARLDHGVLGYPQVPHELAAAVGAHVARAHDWHIEPSWIVPLPGLVCGLHLCARMIGEPGDGVVTTVPIYPPFLSAPVELERTVQHVALRCEDGWRLTTDAVQAAIQPRSKSFWLCQPHNPTGRIFDSDELGVVAAAAEQHGLTVVSDEIWSDLILEPGQRHRPYAMHSEAAAMQSITLMAPSKTFNLPGLGCSVAIIPNPTLRRTFIQTKGRQLPDVNIMGLIAAVAAYQEGGEWLTRCRAYLLANRTYLAQRLIELPKLRWQPGAATYLAWMDVRGCGREGSMAGIERPAAACRQAGLFLSDGAYFGSPGWLRLNFACARTTLEAACDRLIVALRG